jgi:hypothetical protein
VGYLCGGFGKTRPTFLRLSRLSRLNLSGSKVFVNFRVVRGSCPPPRPPYLRVVNPCVPFAQALRAVISVQWAVGSFLNPQLAAPSPPQLYACLASASPRLCVRYLCGGFGKTRPTFLRLLRLSRLNLSGGKVFVNFRVVRGSYPPPRPPHLRVVNPCAPFAQALRAVCSGQFSQPAARCAFSPSASLREISLRRFWKNAPYLFASFASFAVKSFRQ